MWCLEELGLRLKLSLAVEAVDAIRVSLTIRAAKRSDKTLMGKLSEKKG